MCAEGRRKETQARRSRMQTRKKKNLDKASTMPEVTSFSTYDKGEAGQGVAETHNEATFLL